MGSIEPAADAGVELLPSSELPTAPGLIKQWHSEPRRLRIIHIGAGATGLCCAYKMERQLSNYELVCYEKNPEVGGTWYENRYPGCACDVPAHSYTYTFEPNPNWSSYYAYSPEILRYFQGFQDKYDLGKYVKLNHRVVSTEWHEERGQWKVQVEHNGQVFTDWCHILINGSGLLNKWKWPAIEGLHSFEGKLVHSAAWDDSTVLEGKKVAILGTGSSAIQIIPEVQPVASKLTCFMRSNTWIAPPMPRVEIDALETRVKAELGANVLDEANTRIDELVKDIQPSIELATTTITTADDHVEGANGANGANGVGPHKQHQKAAKIGAQDIKQYYYTPEEMEKLRSDPEYFLQYRKKIEFAMNSGFKIFYKDSQASKLAKQYMAAEMARRLNYHPELMQRLIPDWDVGCRRLTPGDGYLEALIQPNVQPIYKEIVSVDQKGLTTEDGVHHEFDVIICATGFDMAWTPHFEVRGVNGVRLQDAWSAGPNCYLGIGAPGYPNYWVMNGPRGNLCNGTVVPCFETQLDYVIEAAKKIQRDRIRSLEVKESIATSLNEYIDKWHQGGVWSGDCKSWYKNNSKDGKIMCWGGSSMHYLKSIKYPRWEHYEVRYIDENPWGFLGNGRTHGEVLEDFDMLTPYMRNSDTPWDIE